MQRRIRVVFSIIPFRQLGCLYYEEARNFAPPPYDGFAFVVVICTIAQPQVAAYSPECVEEEFCEVGGSKQPVRRSGKHPTTV
jgi:hypothetical protein